jgi:hypothetical protein
VASIGIGPSVLGAVQQAGERFYVDDTVMVRQVGTGREYKPGRARLHLRVTGGAGAQPQAGEKVVTRFVAISDRERAELHRLTERVVALVEAHGLPLSSRATRAFAELKRPGRAAEIAKAAKDPRQAVESGFVRDLWQGGEAGYAGGPLLDTDVFPNDLMHRWATLQATRDDSTLAIFISRIG